MGQPAEYLEDVRNQYEVLPYPPRDAEFDKKTLVIAWGALLDYLNMEFWQGRKPFDDSFRALVAGCGTGDAAIFLGEMLREKGGKIIALDMSSASLDVVRKRVETRGLTNIEIVHASILDLPTLDLGAFDYINCSGVLHHMADPSAGLNALKAVLKDDGVANIMVYAQYGRTGIYMAQEFLRSIMRSDDDYQTKIDVCKAFLQTMPDTNWLKHKPDLYLNESNVLGDAGLYDLLLHSQDRAYTVDEVYDWIEESGMHLMEFTPLMLREDIIYTPESYLQPSDDLKQRLDSMTKREKQAVAELLCGNIIKHQVNVTKEKLAPLDPMNESLIPGYTCCSLLLHTDLNLFKEKFDELEKDKEMTIHSKSMPSQLTFTKRDYSADLLLAIDNTRTLGEIFDAIAESKDGDKITIRQAVREEWRELSQSLLNSYNLVLRTADSPAFSSVREMHMAMIERMGYETQKGD